MRANLWRGAATHRRLHLPAALVLGLLASCDSSSPPDPTCSVTGVTVTADQSTIPVGGSVTLTATVNAGPACGGGVTWSVTPAGGTLTPNGLTATFTAPAAGVYTIAATSADDAARSGSATVTVSTSTVPCGQPNGSVVTHSADITASEAWAGGGVTHRVPSSISLRSDAVVTIAACAIVELGPGVSISLRDNSQLVSAGLNDFDSFVTFRRADPGQAWGTLRGYTHTSLIDLRDTYLVGGGAFGGLGDPTIAVSGEGYGSPNAAVLRVQDVYVSESAGVGVWLDANAAFTSDSDFLSISGSGGRPVHTTMMALGSIPDGNYIGNGTDEILIHGPTANVFADMTVRNLGVPVRIPFTGLYVGPAPPATSPVTLTLRPGVVFEFPRVGGQPGARMTFGTNGAAPNNLTGVLNAMGTAAEPIIFTSGEDTPTPGDWEGIWLNTANGSRLDYVEVSYAGAPNGIQSNNCRPASTEDQAAILVGSFSDQYVPPADLITNSRIAYSAYYGINAMWLAPTFNSPDLTTSNVFENNARCRQTFNGVLPPGVCPTNGGCTAP
jgi:hypothetical protein